MKVKKEALEGLTEKLAAVGSMSLLLLAATRCPEPGIYAEIEGYLRDNDALRKDLELKPLFPEEMLNGYFSGKIADVVKQVREMRAKMPMKREPIGFHIPDKPKDSKDWN
jgi:hypothetical protein